MRADSAPKILVVVDDPDRLPDAHIDSCERVAGIVPVIAERPHAQSSGYVTHLDEVRERFPSVLWCECMDDVRSFGVPYAAENIATLTQRLEYRETLSSGDTSVDVYYYWELGGFLFAVDGRPGARLSFDAFRDEWRRPEVFAESAARAVEAVRWADQEWQVRRSRPQDA